MSRRTYSSADLLNVPFQKAQRITIGEYRGGPLDHIKRLIQPLPDEEHEQHSLFVEQLHLDEPDTTVWHEKARWIKYQETAEEDGHRWSKPHISLLTLPGLLQARNCFTQGAVLLDYDADSFEDVAYEVVDQWTKQMLVGQKDGRIILRILLGKKKHLLIHHVAEELGRALTQTFQHGSQATMPRTGSKSKMSASDLTKLDSPSPSINNSHTPRATSAVKFAITDDLHDHSPTDEASPTALKPPDEIHMIRDYTQIR